MRAKQNEIRKNLGEVAYTAAIRQLMRAQKRNDEI
jgi:hypothetical protein